MYSDLIVIFRQQIKFSYSKTNIIQLGEAEFRNFPFSIFNFPFVKHFVLDLILVYPDLIVIFRQQIKFSYAKTNIIQLGEAEFRNFPFSIFNFPFAKRFVLYL